MDPAKAMYPNQWQGVLPEGYTGLASQNVAVDVNIFYNIEYMKHRFCSQWTSTENIKILFHGCGTGEGLMVCALRYPYARFTACDPAPEALELARRYAGEIGLESIEFVDEKDLSGSYDFIWSARPLHHYDDVDAFFASVKACLAPDGLFAFMVDADIENRYYLDFTGRLHEILNAAGDEPAFLQAMESFKSELAEFLEDAVWPSSGVLNVPGIFRLMDAQGLQILEFVNHYNYDPVRYMPVPERQDALRCADERLGHALAELISGQMLRHYLILGFPGRQRQVPGPEDPDIKNLIAWRSPFIAMRNDGDRVVLSLNHAHLNLDERIVLEDVSVPAKMLDIIRRMDSTSSLQVIHRRFLPMSWDVFSHLIQALWECELIYLHRK